MTMLAYVSKSTISPLSGWLSNRALKPSMKLLSQKMSPPSTGGSGQVGWPSKCQGWPGAVPTSTRKIAPKAKVPVTSRTSAMGTVEPP